MPAAIPPAEPRTTMDRRTFLQTTPALFAGLHLVPLSAMAGHLRSDAPRVRAALIGCGWYGKSDLMRLLQVADVEVVGLCDVDRHMLEGAAALVKERQAGADPKLYEDYASLLAETKPEIVLIGTPDHWHALPAIAAIESGAHVYLQKPVGVDIRECEAVLDAARKHERVVQVGMQRRSTPPPGGGKAGRRGCRPARNGSPRGHLLLLPDAGQRGAGG